MNKSELIKRMSEKLEQLSVRDVDLASEKADRITAALNPLDYAIDLSAFL